MTHYIGYLVVSTPYLNICFKSVKGLRGFHDLNLLWIHISVAVMAMELPALYFISGSQVMLLFVTFPSVTPFSQNIMETTF
jgi:hypothetical protein